MYENNAHYIEGFNEVLGTGLTENTEKMNGLAEAAKTLAGNADEAATAVDGIGSGGSEGSGGTVGTGGGGSSLTRLVTDTQEAGDNVATLTNNTNEFKDNAVTDAEEVGTAIDENVVQKSNDGLTSIDENQKTVAQNINDSVNGVSENTNQKIDTTRRELEWTARTARTPGEQFIATFFPGMDEGFIKVENLIKAINGIPSKRTITIEYIETGAHHSQSHGGGARAEFAGTVGNAFASGYPGLKHFEKNALRSEFGQPELTVYPNGRYELTTKPVISDLPKDTVIFNEEQTKRILKAGKKGNAYAEGTGMRPLADVMPDKAALFSKFESNLANNMNSIQSNLDLISKNTAEINSNLANKITNNNMGMSYVNNGDINITCPGVTSQEVLDSITSQLNKTFFGMATNSYQRAMKRG